MIKIKCKNRHGFTLVELLAAIVILGILSTMAMVGVSKLINSAKNENNIQNENTISMATESYLQANTSFRPKSIGEAVNVSVRELKKNNYITEDIVNSNGDSCMKNSYVRVYKLSVNEYTYTPYLYCGDETVPEEEVVPEPTIDLYFTDASGEKNDSIFNNVSEARVVIKLTGGKTATGNDIAIDGYSFSISTKKLASENYQEVYNSGTLSANREKSISEIIKISDYVSLTNDTYVSVKVNVINVTGGMKELSTSANDNTEAIYNDQVKPECQYISSEDNPYSGSNRSWINNSGNDKDRTIKVICNDEGGSGCLRDTFSKSWPNEEEPDGAEKGYIRIEDNNGNSYDCLVDVNVDLVSPTIVAKAYKASDNNLNTTGNNLLTKNVKSDDSNIVTIESEDYSGLTGKWFNNTYQNGLVYEFQVSDNLHLAEWKWEVNEENLTSSTNGWKATSVIASGNFDTIGTGADEEHGATNGTIKVALNGDGQRYGIFTVSDAAGNSTSIEVHANIDRVAPPVPVVSAKKISGGTAYQQKVWTNAQIMVYVNNSYSTDAENPNKSILSGWSHFEYKINETITGKESFTFKENKTYDGKNKVYYRNCDSAGNCSAWSNEFQVWIDTIAPQCNVSSTRIADSKTIAYDGSWVNTDVTVTATCVENSTDSSSGCTSPGTFSYNYTSDISTTNAGAKGNGTGGEVTDIAGNKASCGKTTVKIDKTPPTCTVTGGTASWTNGTRTITAECTDSPSGSGCVSNKITKEYTVESGGVLSITNAGAFGINILKPVQDNAGNYSQNCPADQEVHIDKKNPTGSCSVSNYKLTNSTSDDNSGVKATSIKYAYSTSSTAPSVSSTKWTTSKNASKTPCDKTLYAYMYVEDKAGNNNRISCGTYEGEKCCDDTNYTKCNWVTACRKGITNIHRTPSLSTYAGVVCHLKVPASYWTPNNGKSCDESTKLYMPRGYGSSFTYVEYTGGQGGTKVSPKSGVGKGYIKNSCINDPKKEKVNATCPRSSCPG